MKRTLVVLMVALCVTGYVGRAAAGGKRLPSVKNLRPDPVSLIELLDELTRRPTAATTTARLRATFPQQKIQVASSKVDVSVRRGERSWRGEVVADLHVPTTVRYTIDLATLEPRHLRWDPVRRVLRVTAPPVQVESVSPQLSQMEVEHQYRGWRMSLLDAGAAANLERAALRDDYEPEARAAAAAQMPAVRSQARAQLQDLLRKCFRAAAQDVTVVVE